MSGPECRYGRLFTGEFSLPRWGGRGGEQVVQKRVNDDWIIVEDPVHGTPVATPATVHAHLTSFSAGVSKCVTPPPGEVPPPCSRRLASVRKPR